MLQRLNYDDEDNTNPRVDLDNSFHITEWYVPGLNKYREIVPAVEGVPDWWHGEEDASASFLRAMNVNT